MKEIIISGDQLLNIPIGKLPIAISIFSGCPRMTIEASTYSVDNKNPNVCLVKKVRCIGSECPNPRCQLKQIQSV